jgi:hypothetical protein
MSTSEIQTLLKAAMQLDLGDSSRRWDFFSNDYPHLVEALDKIQALDE